MRWNTETEELETVFNGTGIDGSMFEINVISEDRIMLVPTVPNEDKPVKVYSVSDGKISECFAFEMWGSTFLTEGAAVCCHPDEDRMEIRSFDGGSLFKGDIGTDFLKGIGDSVRVAGVLAAFGDTKELLMSYALIEIRDNEQYISSCIVRYDLTQEHPHGELLIYSPWLT